VRSGYVTAFEVLEASIARLERSEPLLNATASLFVDRALTRAATLPSEALFAGVPTLLKDLTEELDGTPMTSGSGLFRDYVCKSTMPVAKAYEGAGFLIFGRSTSPEFGLTACTESKLHGITRNPWNLARTPGGSSGGAAALVAARVVPLAHGTDGAGSLRIPASYCGLVGLKPSRGRVSRGESWSDLSATHALCRSVRDAAAILQITSGEIGGAPYRAPPLEDFSPTSLAAPPRLRIGMIRQHFNGVPTDPEVDAATLDTAKLCEAMGHHVEEASVEGVDFAALRQAIGKSSAVGMMELFRSIEASRGRPVTLDDVEMVPFVLAQLGAEVSAAEVLGAREAIYRMGWIFAPFFEKYDLMLSPATSQKAAKHGVLSLSPEKFEDFGEAVTRLGLFTLVANVTGSPSISVPLYWTPEGLPIGSMFTARYGKDLLLLQLAAELEKARPWHDRRPPGY
jgi:Asp-tRNA(Asn)/Glu-tRNA(Gln) amidotransferase A subunit family amidase